MSWVPRTIAMPFKLIMDNIPSLIFVKDEESRLVYANSAFLALFPLERRAGIIGHTTVENFSPEQAALFLAEDRRALALGQTEMVEEIVDHTGRRRVFRSRKVAFTTATGERRLLGVSDDITELADREKHLAEINNHLQSFAALAAHDLRSPLGSCVNAMEMILADKQSVLSPRARTYLDMMIATAGGLAESIQSLLLATKASYRNDAITFAPCDLNLTLQEVRFSLSQIIERSGAQVYASRLPVLNVEARLLRQLLQNLIENSIKYRKAGVAPTIIIRCEAQGDRHVFSVEDNGQGVSSQTAGKMFEMYEQNAQNGVAGVGLGLSLCKRIVELHKGEIWIDAAWTSGCKIMWSLPRARIDPPCVDADRCAA